MSLNIQLTLQDNKLKALEETLGNFTSRPILDFDVTKLKDLVCDTFRANKRSLMRRGATQVRELIAKKLEQKVRNEMHNKEVEDIKSLQ
jgi:hypothetical protein